MNSPNYRVIKCRKLKRLFDEIDSEKNCADDTEKLHNIDDGKFNDTLFVQNSGIGTMDVENHKADISSNDQSEILRNSPHLDSVEITNLDIESQDLSDCLPEEISSSSSSDYTSCDNNDQSDTFSDNDDEPEVDVNVKSILYSKERAKANLRSKLHVWCIKHRNNLTNKCIEDLLTVLRDEVPQNLPKSVATLIPSKNNSEFEIRTMNSLRNKEGYYVYFGITNALKKIINPEIFLEKDINLLFNIDGMQVFQNSRQQLWPILGKVYHKDYKCSPFLVSIFGGNSKPLSVDDYLKDFVDEINTLLNKGIKISEKFYNIIIRGFTCDTPARSFLKVSKGHGGFFPCERCETKGVTKKREEYILKQTAKLGQIFHLELKRKRSIT